MAIDAETLPPPRRALAFHAAVDQSIIQSDKAVEVAGDGGLILRYAPSHTILATESTGYPADSGLSGLNALTTAFCWTG